MIPKIIEIRRCAFIFHAVVINHFFVELEISVSLDILPLMFARHLVFVAKVLHDLIDRVLIFFMHQEIDIIEKKQY